mgnify:CR=1 FL=1
MSLTKKTVTDKIEIIKADKHYIIQIREAIQVLENGNLLSQSFNRYSLAPDADVSTISDDVVKAQFNAVMTDEVKANYAKFLKEQAEQNKPS